MGLYAYLPVQFVEKVSHALLESLLTEFRELPPLTRRLLAYLHSLAYLHLLSCLHLLASYLPGRLRGRLRVAAGTY